MRTITESFAVYRFNELPEKVQRELIEAEIEAAGDFWDGDEMRSHWSELLEDIGFPNAEVGYSGFCSPGDGASFTCSSVDLAKLYESLKTGLKLINPPGRDVRVHTSQFDMHVFDWLVFFEVENDCNFSIERTQFCRYVHDNTITCEWEYRPVLNPFDSHLMELSKAIQELARDLSRLMYREFEEDYSYCRSRETALERIQDDAHEYRIDGTIYE